MMPVIAHNCSNRKYLLHVFAVFWLSMVIFPNISLGQNFPSRFVPEPRQCWGLLSNDPVGQLIRETSGFKVEIGAADSPICDDCIQIDKYRSVKDLFTQQLSKQLGRPPLPSEIENQLERSTALRHEFEAPWAVAIVEKGVVGDANHLPLAASSVSLLISKHFPWFGPLTRKDEIIRPILQEYHRVMKNDGKVLLLTDHPRNWEIFMMHYQIAQDLGFKVLFVDAPMYSGLILSKP